MQLLAHGSLEPMSAPRLYVACPSANAGDLQRTVLDELENADVTVFIGTGKEPELDQWRLDLMESATVIGIWIDSQGPNEDAMLELGLAATTGKLIVGCPRRSGQRALVEPICTRYGIPLVEDVKVFAIALREELQRRAPSSSGE